MKAEQKPLIIGIAGGSGSGKTTVVDNIAARIYEPDIITIIRHDDYYKDQKHLSMAERLEVNYDHPFSLNNDLLVEHLKKLKNNETIEKPIYDFTSYTRAAETETIVPTNIIILEGILTLEDERLRSLMDIKIYVQTPADIRLIRRLERDVQQRGRNLSSVLEQYTHTVRVMHEEFISPSKRYADIIIPTGGDNQVAIDLLLARIYSTQ